MNKTESNRLQQVEESSTLAMAALAREYRSKGVDVISLSLGEPDFKTPTHICDGAKEAIDSGNYFSYPPVAGYSDLREEISKKFIEENKLKYDPNQIIVSNGVKHSITNVMFSILNKGDEVIVFSPFWVSYSAIITLAEGIPVYINTSISNDFKPSENQLKDAITKKTKAIIFSSPCNPTGTVFSRKDLKKYRDILADYPNIVIISDEIYEHINFTNEHCSFGSLDGMSDRTITMNGFSKAFAMTGWRLGYIGAPKEIAKSINKMQGQTTSANCSIAQRAGYAALRAGNECAIEMRNSYLKRRDLVFDKLNSISNLKVNLPKGAFYFFPEIDNIIGKIDKKGVEIKSSNDLAMYLLEDAKISLVPGEDFGAPNCIRLSYAASESDLVEACKRLDRSIQKLN
tara:strand:- start:10684 stop:11886 length:1203 start_codon:yes stop_codon:yes gene_type:complete